MADHTLPSTDVAPPTPDPAGSTPAAPEALPQYDGTTLATLTAPELMALMARDEDRVPRNVIDECARRGDAILDEFDQLLLNDRKYWSDDTATGDWWLHTHAIRTLGLMDSVRAGEMLVNYLRQMDAYADDNLMDWHTGHWPMLFENKPQSIDPLLLDYVRSGKHTSYTRYDALQAALKRANQQGPATLERLLDDTANICADEDEDGEARMLLGNALLDFPRERHRALLEKLAQEQDGDFPIFRLEEVHQAFGASPPEPPQNARESPWKFYEPAEIAARQQRWREEAEDENGQDDDAPGLDDDDVPMPYVRAAPKVGRNDPCPCGSGKKYKKCCLDTA